MPDTTGLNSSQKEKKRNSDTEMDFAQRVRRINHLSQAGQKEEH